MSNKNNYEENDWGSKKVDYYSRNKRDKDQNNLIDEEEEAYKIQKERLKKLQQANLLESDEESFEEKKEIKKINLDSSDDENDNKNESILIQTSDEQKGQRKITIYKTPEIKKNYEKKYSSDELNEFTQLLKNIRANTGELYDNLIPLETALLVSDDLNLEKTRNYLKNKKQARLIYLTYLTFYLHFKAKGKINDHHPVIKKMYFLKSIINSDKEYKERINSKFDEFLQLLEQKRILEEGNHEDNKENLEEEEEDDENLDLNENEEIDDEEDEDEIDILEEREDDDDINVEDILELQNNFNDEEQHMKKKKKKEKNSNDKFLNQKRANSNSVLDLDFNKKGPKESKETNKDKIVLNDFVNQNMEALKALKTKKLTIDEKKNKQLEKEIINKSEMGQRVANKNMLKARGIYRKRKQYQGNAKLHNREKYMKKQKLRKNMVKEYEGKPLVYEGEKTGIRRDLNRATKFK